MVVSNGTAKLIAAPLNPPYPSENCQGGACTYKAGLLSTARPRADNGSRYLYSFTYAAMTRRESTVDDRDFGARERSRTAQSGAGTAISTAEAPL